MEQRLARLEAILNGTSKIDDSVIEALAKEFCLSAGFGGWDKRPESNREVLRNCARAALTAALAKLAEKEG